MTEHVDVENPTKLQKCVAIVNQKTLGVRRFR